MGPAQMCGFFVRWTGWWDVDDDNDHSDSEDGYWMGMARSKFSGSSLGADWSREEGKGIVRYGNMTYNLPATKTATFTRQPGGKIAVSVTAGNIHDSWNEYYGFGKDKSVDDYGYYKNNDYGTVQLNNTTGAASYTLKGTFDETTNHTIYYHEYYKRTQHTTNQHFQGSRLSFVVKGFTYPTNVTATQNKWNKTVTLQWTVNNNKKNANYDQDGEWIVFRKKEGDSKYSILTRFKNNVGDEKCSYVDKDIETLNSFVMDSLRACATKRRKIGGLGSVNDRDDYTILRGTGKNVTANRLKTEKEIVGYLTLGCMQNAILTSRPVYEALVRSM
jgi:hypothetical protein